MSPGCRKGAGAGAAADSPGFTFKAGFYNGGRERGKGRPWANFEGTQKPQEASEAVFNTVFLEIKINAEKSTMKKLSKFYIGSATS